MMKNIGLWVICVVVLVACGSEPTDEEIMANYRADVAGMNMPTEWKDWMLEREDVWAKAYISGRRDHTAHVFVRYEHPAVYDPPWASEEEHFTALKRMAEMEYPSWKFAFTEYYPGVSSDEDAAVNVIAVLGHSGYSYAEGNTVYLVFETVFGHEFGHILGLRHHYCGDNYRSSCEEESPPSEGICLMSRDSMSFGPTERFLLGLTGERHDVQLRDLAISINARYPKGDGQ